MKNIIIYLLILGFTTPLLAAKYGEQMSSSDTLKIGDLCPDFAMEDTSRVQISLKSLRGKYVYIDVWASWCSPCKKEYPSFHKLEEELHSDDIVFLSVSTDVSIFRWNVGIGGLYNGAKGKRGMHWRVLDEEFEAKFNIYRLPRFILLDKDGRIVRKDMTRPSKPETKKYLVELLGLQTQQKIKEYRIVVKMEHVNKEAPAILGSRVNGKFHIDTCFANSNNEFIFEGEVPIINGAFLNLSHHELDPTMPPNNDDGTSVYLEEGELLIVGKDSIRTAKISGTPTNEICQQLHAIQKAYDKKAQELNRAYSKATEEKDQEKAATLEKEYNDLMAVKFDEEKEFFLNHTNSKVSLDWLRRNINVSQEKALASELFNRLSDDLKVSPEGLSYANLVKRTESAGINANASDFSAKQPNGDMLSLKSLRGQYVLLDFWASWCGPCRKENPNLVKAYSAYKNKNFTILGYSLDGGNNGHKAWTAAIEKDGLVWNQVSDMMGWQSPTVQSYGVTAVPANFLIDPKGKIIAKNLRGEELETMLKEVLE